MTKDRTNRIIETLAPQLRKGFTFDPVAFTHYSGSGYAVSITDNRSKDRQTALESGLKCWEWYSEGKALSSAMYPVERYYLGGWQDLKTGEHCVDVTIVILNKWRAIKTARENNQSAIYSFETGETISV